MEFLTKFQILPISAPPGLPHIKANLTPAKSRNILEIDHESTQIHFDLDKRNGLDIETDCKIDINIEANPKNPNLNVKKHPTQKSGTIQNQMQIKNQNVNCPFRVPSARKTNSLLHINYNGHQAALVCQVCTADLNALKQRLWPVLRKYKSRFSNIRLERNPFRPMSLIFASLPNVVGTNYSHIENKLHRDAKQCKALGYRIVNNKTGELCFNCLPADVQRVSARLKKCGYKPQHTELAHFARDPLMNFSTSQWHNYSDFLNTLKADTDVLKVYANVQTSSLNWHLVDLCVGAE